MATKNIIKLLEKGNVTKDLKVAYSFMLLSRGYSADEIKALDDYDFLIRKKSSKITGETNQMDVATPRNRRSHRAWHPVMRQDDRRRQEHAAVEAYRFPWKQ